MAGWHVCHREEMDGRSLPEHLHGVVGRVELLESGLTPKRLQTLRAEGLAERVSRTTYVLAGSSDGPLRRHAVAQERVGEPAAFTGRSAAWLHGLVDRPPGRPQLVVPLQRRPLQGTSDAQVIRTQRWELVRMRNSGGLRLAAVEWALLDLARMLSDRELAEALATADALRLTTVERVRSLLERRGRFPGCARLRRVVEAMTRETSHSRTEGRARRRLAELGFPAYPRPFPIRRDGRILAGVDIAFPHDCYGVEVDGPFHLLAAQRARDEARDRSIIPWHIARYSVYEIDADLHRVCREIIAGLQRVRAGRPGDHWRSVEG